MNTMSPRPSVRVAVEGSHHAMDKVSLCNAPSAKHLLVFVVVCMYLANTVISSIQAIAQDIIPNSCGLSLTFEIVTSAHVDWLVNLLLWHMDPHTSQSVLRLKMLFEYLASQG